MQVIKVKKGINIPITGDVTSEEIRKVSSDEYAFVAADYPGLMPRVLVKVGDKVKAGDKLVYDKGYEKLHYFSPVNGEVTHILRGDRRVLQAVVIKRSDKAVWELENLSGYNLKSRDGVIDLLLDTGYLSMFRSRPFGKVADHKATPDAIFVTAMDTRPLAPNADYILNKYIKEFKAGVECISHLTEGNIWVCVSGNSTKGVTLPEFKATNVKSAKFSGPHPAGLAGTHVHFLRPVNKTKLVWEIDYQNVINIGRLLMSGTVEPRKIVSLAGEGVKKPELLDIPEGANILKLVDGLIKEGTRVISGSCLYGDKMTEEFAWFGRNYNQITVIPRAKISGAFSWLGIGSKLFSVKRVYLGAVTKSKGVNMDTAQHSPEKAMIPVGSYEKIMPLDIIPSALLRYLAAGDTEMSENLGALELLEEDLSLATYVSPGKTDYGLVLRDVLNAISKEM